MQDQHVFKAFVNERELKCKVISWTLFLFQSKPGNSLLHALSYRVWRQCIDWQIHELANMSYVVDTQKLESVIRKLCLRRTNYRYTLLYFYSMLYMNWFPNRRCHMWLYTKFDKHLQTVRTKVLTTQNCCPIFFYFYLIPFYALK